MAIKVQNSKLHKLGTIGDCSLQAQQPGSNATTCSTVAWPGLAQNRHSLRSRHRASWTQPSPATVMDTMATSSRSPVSVIVPPPQINLIDYMGQTCLPTVSFDTCQNQKLFYNTLEDCNSRQHPKGV